MNCRCCKFVTVGVQPACFFRNSECKGTEEAGVPYPLIDLIHSFHFGIHSCGDNTLLEEVDVETVLMQRLHWYTYTIELVQ